MEIKNGNRQRKAGRSNTQRLQPKGQQRKIKAASITRKHTHRKIGRQCRWRNFVDRMRVIL